MPEELKQDMLHTIDTKVRYDNLFHWFEENKFTNEGNYPRNTNLVFEFSEWLENVDGSELAERLGLYANFKDVDDVENATNQAREEMMRGIDNWLKA
jgi:hypothetical protein